MASQIAHIIYAKKYFDRLENRKAENDFLDEEKINQHHKINKDEFILGVVFPDIRMIEPSIKRKDTHLRFEPLNLDFSGLTSFEAGWKFHLYCDMRREEILNQQNFYKLKRTSDLFGRPVKLLEDVLLYDNYNNWEKMTSYFRNPPRVNLKIEVDRQTFVLWYAILAKYIEEKVTLKTISILLSKLPKLATESREIIDTVKELEQDALVIKKLLVVQEEIV
ncbi:MAG: hypothetical protein WCK16_02815 [Candidatus Moraniibacteriota bacterium]